MISKEKHKNEQKQIQLFIALGIVLAVALFAYLAIQRSKTQGEMSAISGSYSCSGTERGLYALAGFLEIGLDGSFAMTGMYAPNASGTLYWLNKTQLAPREDGIYALFIVGTIYDADQIRIELKEGVTFGHADTGYLLCDPYTR